MYSITSEQGGSDDVAVQAGTNENESEVDCMVHRTTTLLSRFLWAGLPAGGALLVLALSARGAATGREVAAIVSPPATAGSAVVLLGTDTTADPTGQPAAIPAGQVSIQSFSFGPQTLTIPAGTTVTWTNSDSVTHTVTAMDGSFDSGNLTPGQSFSFTFTTPGTYSYHCSIHPFMRGQVVVQ